MCSVNEGAGECVAHRRKGDLLQVRRDLRKGREGEGAGDKEEGGSALEQPEEVRMTKQVAGDVERSHRRRSTCRHLCGAPAPRRFSSGRKVASGSLTRNVGCSEDLRRLPAHVGEPLPKGRNDPCSPQEQKDS